VLGMYGDMGVMGVIGDVVVEELNAGEIDCGGCCCCCSSLVIPTVDVVDSAVDAAVD